MINDSTRFVTDSPWLRGGGRLTAPAVPSSGRFVTTGEDWRRFLGQYDPSWEEENYPVMVRFGPSHKQKAYRLVRTGPGTEYMVQDVNPTPEINVTAFDVSNPAAPRQLTLSWRDNNTNGVWDPPVADDGLEILFVHNRTYDPNMAQYAHSGNGQAAIINECTVGDKADIMYGLSLRLVEGATLNQSDISIRVRPALRLAVGTAYTFSMQGIQASNDQAKQELSRVGVFPNPYFAINPQETNKLSRFVTFNNLPEQATIRIFNLAGQLVRTLEKNTAPEETRMQWNLQNQIGLPVASGMYIAHVEGVLSANGETVSKVLKLAVIQEQEILDIF
jgi:hypothetical protein